MMVLNAELREFDVGLGDGCECWLLKPAIASSRFTAMWGDGLL